MISSNFPQCIHSCGHAFTIGCIIFMSTLCMKSVSSTYRVCTKMVALQNELAGETKRSWNSRGSEHKPGTHNNRESALKDHAETADHDISINHGQMLEKNVNNWQKITFLESWHSTQDNNTMNERKPLPSIYKCLMKPQREQ